MFVWSQIPIKIAWITLTMSILLLYIPLGKMITNGKKFKTRLDDHIPLLPIFIVPYFLWYPFLTLIYLIVFFNSLSMMQETSLTIILAAIMIFACNIYYPTYMETYQVKENSIYSRLVCKLYQWDRRYNAFPSNHVAYSLIALFYLFKYFPTWGMISSPLVVLIVLSTVFLKQHYLPDILGGAATAAIAIFLIQGVF